MNFVKGTVSDGKIQIGNTMVSLAEILAPEVLKTYEGKKMIFGFRPEAIELGNKADSYVLNAEVELTELLGDNTNVYIDIDGTKSILKVDPHDTPKMDTRIDFSIPYSAVYLFDGETENVIETTKKAY